jgi:hypothetical protein
MEGLSSPSALEAGLGVPAAPLLDTPRAARVRVDVHAKRTGLLPLVLLALLVYTSCARLALDAVMISSVTGRQQGVAVVDVRRLEEEQELIELIRRLRLDE